MKRPKLHAICDRRERMHEKKIMQQLDAIDWLHQDREDRIAWDERKKEIERTYVCGPVETLRQELAIERERTAKLRQLLDMYLPGWPA